MLEARGGTSTLREMGSHCKAVTSGRAPPALAAACRTDCIQQGKKQSDLLRGFWNHPGQRRWWLVIGKQLWKWWEGLGFWVCFDKRGFRSSWWAGYEMLYKEGAQDVSKTLAWAREMGKQWLELFVWQEVGEIWHSHLPPSIPPLPSLPPSFSSSTASNFLIPFLLCTSTSADTVSTDTTDTKHPHHQSMNDRWGREELMVGNLLHYTTQLLKISSWY